MWTRSEPHRQWRQSFLKDSGGTGFWHETYFEAWKRSYDDVMQPIGFMGFAPVLPARGLMFGAAPGAARNSPASLYCLRRNCTGDRLPN
jgi:hypothetical protein